MAAFKTLKDVCVNFDKELQRVSAELFSVKSRESYELGIADKMREYSLINAKLKLLQAKPIALTHQVTEHDKDQESTYSKYGDTAAYKVLERQFAKAVTQSHAVRTLVMTPDTKLDPELIERKERIINHLNMYSENESYLRHFDKLLKEKEVQLQEVREQWERELRELGELREMGSNLEDEVDCTGPLYNKLNNLVEKMNVMKWLIGRLVTSRSADYDWMADPHRRLKVLKLARETNCVKKYLDS